jgi:hypothetical protein
MMKQVFGAGLLLTAVAAVSIAGAAAPGEAQERGSRHGSEARTERGANGRLNRLIQERLRADGPFFNAEERAVIEQACGYAPGSWDGFEANISDGAFTCSNGRRVDTPQVQAVIEAAGPRIGARVDRVMASADVQEAIGEVAERAQAAALASIDVAEIGRRAAAEARVEVRRAMEEMERDLADKRRERRQAR